MKKFLPTSVATVFLIAAFVLVSFTNPTGKASEKPGADRLEATTVNYYSDYTVTIGINISTLRAVVKEHMAEGWQPIGGVTYSNQTYLQVMVK